MLPLSTVKQFYPKQKIIILAIATTVMAIISTNSLVGTKALSANFPVWVAPSLQRIALNENAGSQTDIKLFAARGEYESFQIGIKAPQGGLTNGNVSISDLSGPDSSVISKANITLYREHYVPVNNTSRKWEGGSNQPLPSGLYADALIPFVNPDTKAELKGNELDAVPFKLDGGKNQPIWIDVFVPRNAKPGEYTGQYTVTSDQGSVTGKISLKVWNFELPLKPSLKSAFIVWEQANKNTFVELLKHKIMPAVDMPPEYQRKLIDEWGLTSIKLPFFSNATYTNNNMLPPPAVDAIKAEAAQNQSDLFQYIISVDEIDRWPELQGLVKEWGKNIKQAGVKNGAVMTPVTELSQFVDFWVVLPRMYQESRDKVSQALKNKNEVWLYTALAGDEYSPKWLTDFAPINFRIPHGFINQSLGLSGMFYWRVDLWQGNPWFDEQTVLEFGNYYAGEGMFLYPGKQVGVEGVVPSMRLKWIRDGVEDYEYAQILKKLGRQDRATEITRTVARDFKNWTKDPEKLEEAKQILGNEIEEVIS
jgi:Domain of unknown function (DUF4091)